MAARHVSQHVLHEIQHVAGVHGRRRRLVCVRAARANLDHRGRWSGARDRRHYADAIRDWREPGFRRAVSEGLLVSRESAPRANGAERVGRSDERRHHADPAGRRRQASELARGGDGSAQLRGACGRHDSGGWLSGERQICLQLGQLCARLPGSGRGLHGHGSKPRRADLATSEHPRCARAALGPGAPGLHGAGDRPVDAPRINAGYWLCPDHLLQPVVHATLHGVCLYLDYIRADLAGLLR